MRRLMPIWAASDMQQRKFDNALASVRRVLELSPEAADAHAAVASALKEQGKLDEALAFVPPCVIAGT